MDRNRRTGRCPGWTLVQNATEYWPDDGDRIGNEKRRAKRHEGPAGEGEGEAGDRVIEREYANAQVSHARERLGDPSQPREDHREKRRGEPKPGK